MLEPLGYTKRDVKRCFKKIMYREIQGGGEKMTSTAYSNK